MKNTAKHSQWVLVLLLLLTQTITPTIVLLSPKKKKIDLDTPKKSIKTTEALKKSITKVTKNSKISWQFSHTNFHKINKKSPQERNLMLGPMSDIQAKLPSTSVYKFLNKYSKKKPIDPKLVGLAPQKERKAKLLTPRERRTSVVMTHQSLSDNLKNDVGNKANGRLLLYLLGFFFYWVS